MAMKAALRITETEAIKSDQPPFSRRSYWLVTEESRPQMSQYRHREAYGEVHRSLGIDGRRFGS